MTLVDPASDSYVIATKTGITMAVTTAKTATFTINFNTPSTIGVYSTANQYMELLITPGVYVAAGCKATIVFPSEITYQSTLAIIGFVNSMDYTSSTSTLANTITSYCTEWASETGIIDPYIKVKQCNIFVQVKGPPQVKDTSIFSFTLTTSAGDAIATATAYVPSSSITAGTISQFIFAYVSGASTVVQTTTTWKIGFTLADKLLNPWKIVVTYPNSDFTISSCTPTNGVGFTTASTTCSVSGNTITITGTYDIAAGAVSFEGLAGTNPNAVITIGSFTARSYNTISGTDYAVDVYNTDSTFSNCFTPTAQTLTSVSVAINSPATYSYAGLSNVLYDFTVGHQSTFYSGYQVTITIPSSG